MKIKTLNYIFEVFVILLLIILAPKASDILSDLFLSNNNQTQIVKNNYYKKSNYNFVREKEELTPYGKEDLLDIFYTILNSGMSDYTFYCPKEYKSCISDVEEIVKDNSLLNNINNFINPFNSFTKINISHNESGEVNVNTEKLYSNGEIIKINDKVDLILNNIKKDDTKDVILDVHDYIINNTKYDVSFDKGNSPYSSHKATGPLFEGYATCAGYTDLMAIFLDKLEVKNYKVSSSEHIWNAIYIDGSWLHLDLTWNDPVDLQGGSDTLLHKFYLIDDATLKEYKTNSHDYNKNIYSEFKNLEFSF